MALTLLGKKLGMTRFYTEEERSIPVTVVQVGPCVVTQVRTEEIDGYNAVQIGFDERKPRRTPQPMIGHDAKAQTTPKRMHREFRISAEEVGEYEIGQEITVEALSHLAYVDVCGVSKGKGFQGPMKRHNFAGLEATHGVERKHRSAGSISSHAANAGKSGKIKKGKKMAGHMGAVRSTVRSLDVVKIDAEQDLLLVKGPIPGANKGLVEIRTPSRLYADKALRQAAKAGK